MGGRLRGVDPEDAPAETLNILRNLVVIPNLLSVMATSVPVLRAFQAFRPARCEATWPEKRLSQP